MDDDTVSLTALTLIISRDCRYMCVNKYKPLITQLTLSLYLMTKCQLKLHHSVTSLVQTLDYIEIAQERHSVYRTLDHLTLQFTKRKVMVSLASLYRYEVNTF